MLIADVPRTLGHLLGFSFLCCIRKLDRVADFYSISFQFNFQTSSHGEAFSVNILDSYKQTLRWLNTKNKNGSYFHQKNCVEGLKHF